jgi:putative transcriptional regulator
VPSRRLLSTTEGALKGQLLIAMPGMSDPRFDRTVIYLCAHSSDGAMGLIVNRLADHISFPDLLETLNIDSRGPDRHVRVHFGGPVETSRGFVLHTADYLRDATVPVDERMGLTASVDVLQAMADGNGPQRALLALGYAGWGPGQLDHEIQQNVWLHAPPDDDIIFDGNLDNKWQRAVGKLGIDLSLLSGTAGHA